jgi:predicted metal-dependent phosphoesterase TrpH
MIPLKCDFHVHYIELMPDNPEAMIDKYHALGYDCIVLTEHDQYLNVELQERLIQYAERRYGDELLVGFGEELTFWEDHDRGFNGGDVLGLFTKEKIQYEKHHLPERSIREIREQGGIAISAHDNASNMKTKTSGIWGIRKELEPDGFEIVNAGKKERGFTHPDEAVAEGYICLANTDAHNVDQLEKGCHTHTIAYAKERSILAVKEALEDRRTVAVCGNRLFGREEWVRRCRNK